MSRKSSNKTKKQDSVEYQKDHVDKQKKNNVRGGKSDSSKSCVPKDNSNCQNEKLDKVNYHTFIYPFWVRESENGKDVVPLASNTIISKLWKDDTVKKNIDSEDTDINYNSKIEVKNNKKKYDEYLSAYNQFQYFHRNVRESIMNSNEKNELQIRCYRREISKGTYSIHLPNDKQYTLDMNAIRLKVLDIGIGLLIFECENSKYREFEEIKRINKYGSKTTLQLMRHEDNDNLSCAQKIVIEFEELCRLGKSSKVYQYDFQAQRDKFFETPCVDMHKVIEEGYKIDFFERLIFGEKDENTSQYSLESFIDGEMFVCCVVQDSKWEREREALAGIVSGSDFYSKKLNKVQQEYVRSVYEFLSVKEKNDYKNKDANYILEQLQHKIHRTLLAKKILCAATSNSLITLTTTGSYFDVVEPFLCYHIEIALIVLIQRTMIIRFQERVSGYLSIDRIKQLQTEYVDYRNRVLFLEVTPHKQGIELYELLQKQLYIPKELESLEKQLELLNENATIEMNERLQIIGLLIGLLSLVFGIIDIVMK